ncbi:MAG: hypothetical protein OEZ15_09160 [Gammaproteobacteria bacterium]|nr:hypothetical protein [Gammaproteobacteria bacterium]
MSKKFSNYVFHFILLMSAALLSACSTSNRLAVLDDNAVSVAGGFVRAAKTPGVNVKKVKKLVIPSFKVTHKLKVKGTATTVEKEGDKEITTATKLKVNMENPDIELLQDITNKAYDAVIEELTKEGFEVVSLEEIAKSDAYYQVNHKNLVTSISNLDESVTLVPDGLKYYDSNDKIDPNGSFMLGIANINSAVDGNLVAEFGGVDNGVAVLNIEVQVQFGNFDLDDHRVSPFILFNPSYTVLGNETRFELTTGFKAVTMPGRTFYIPKESGSYVLTQDMGSKTTVLSDMLVIGSEDGAEEYNTTVNPEYFGRAAVEQVARVSELMAKAMME